MIGNRRWSIDSRIVRRSEGVAVAIVLSERGSSSAWRRLFSVARSGFEEGLRAGISVSWIESGIRRTHAVVRGWR